MLPDKEAWRKEFVNEVFVDKIKQYIHDYSIVDNLNISFDFFEQYVTPREQQILRDNFIALPSFYYIDYIRKNSTGVILDIGCGGNFFSYFFDDLVGMDHRLDKLKTIKYVCGFDELSSKLIQNKVDNAIAICSLHFIPLDQIKQRILSFASIIKPRGYGYLGINLARLLDNTEPNKLYPEGLDFLKSNPKMALDYVKKEIASLDLNIIATEYIEDIVDEFIDGNIRILFRNEKKNDISI